MAEEPVVLLNQARTEEAHRRPGVPGGQWRWQPVAVLLWGRVQGSGRNYPRTQGLG
jgi:hypothetical protein